MVNKCVVKGCKTTAIKGSKVHVFPKGDIGLLWVDAVQQYQPNFLLNQRSIICSLHFLSTDYKPSIVSGKLMLNKLAVPNLSIATNIESEVSVEEIKVTMNDVLSKETINFYSSYARCALGFCGNHFTRCAEDEHVSFFKFPDDPVRCAIWIENCGSKYLPNVEIEDLKKRYKLCALHFEDRMFNFQKNRLLSHAVPTIFKNKPPVIKRVTPQNVFETIIIDDDDSPPAIPLGKSVPPAIPLGKSVPPAIPLCKSVPPAIPLGESLPPGVPIHAQTSCSKYDKTNITKNLFDVPTSTRVIKNSVSLQTPNYLSANSPRKLKVKKQLADEVRLKKQLEKTVNELKRQLEQSNSEDNCLKLCEMFLPSTMYLLVKNYLTNKNKTPNGQRHLNEIIRFAHTVYHLGPKAYYFLQTHFTLPHIRTLRKKNIQTIDKNIQNIVQNDHRYSKI